VIGLPISVSPEPRMLPSRRLMPATSRRRARCAKQDTNSPRLCANSCAAWRASWQGCRS